MLVNLPISVLAQKFRVKEITSEDLIVECYDRIEKLGDRINALITLVPRESALEQAKKVAYTSPLSGIPFVMKDAYVTRGVRTTAASKILDTYIPQYSATVYDRLEKAGAILIGKANMDAWGHGASTENTDYGPTLNPWDTRKSAGGSGGGPAAALASRFSVFGIGEDTGGSIRNPAAWNNVTALKVTYGRVSRYGAIAYASSLDTVGPTAKTVEDCAHVLQAIAGHDRYDATSSKLPVPDYLKGLGSIKGKKIALPVEFYGDSLDSAIRESIFEARRVFESLGAEVSDVSLPLLDYGVPLYYILAPSETSSNLSRYDGVRYGAGRDLFTTEAKRRIMTGAYALSSGYYDAYYKKALQVRTLFINEYKKMLDQYDAILSPVTPIMPPTFGELLDDPVKNMMADLYTVTINVVGLPSLALPCGFFDDLPIGMQLVGKMFDEANLLALGAAYQKSTDWHMSMPEMVI